MEGYSTNEEKKLELRLGPPNGDWSKEKDETLFPFGYNISTNNGSQVKQQKFSSFLQLQSTPQKQSVMTQESLQTAGCIKTVNDAEKKAFSPATKTGPVPNSAQKRTAPAPAPVVGWPPIRSFRKNIASSSSSLKPVTESQNVVPNKSDANKKPMEICQKGLFVKINMDGIPIGRKVDLKAYDSYDKLSSAVDELFRGLLAAQSDQSGGGKEKKEEGEKAIRGLLDGSGEYTLVYEDNEGDRMLVGDVPWHMFVSTVKRLRVLKSSDLSTLTRGNKQN
ncbi:PREDICTED: auxin-responsive protein IAA26-like [Nicotiana attenuata]|uniref:Auxin-responsive protein n=1 Tax=Nicotiana attenuata TaxID=49451 RepID=A0A1J6IJG8_NICAT|nr:PREDICTED: auxin-responsive protein IAA26-like [Nicotiana attenuata]OIT05253.1 auxin-responsive protein iaa26 [Nicotiana attenuata]